MPEVDVAGGRVIVTPPAGLFEELPAETATRSPTIPSPRRLPTRTIPRRADVRIDVVSIFPAFFDVLEVSLLGKAREKACWTCGCTTCVTGRTTATAPSTTRPTAAAPAW